MKNKFMVIVLF